MNNKGEMMMETLKKYVTKKYVSYSSIASGILAIILFIMYQTMGSSFSEISDLGSAVSSIKMLCNLYYVNLVFLLVLLAGYAYLLFYIKDRFISTKILASCAAFSTLMSFFSISAVNLMSSVLNGNFSALLGASKNSMDNVPTFLLLMIIGQVALAGIAIYFSFVKKELADETTSKDGNSRTFENTSKKFKEYYATEKGKRNVRIAGIVGIGVIALIIVVSIYQGMKKTVIDLTSTCNIEFVGVSGEGTANINCTPDYDHTNKKIQTFMQGVSYSIEKDGKLSNGDSVVVKASYSEATADSSKVKVENAEKKLKVNGLEEVYHKYADIPKTITKDFETTSKSILETDIKEEEGSMFGPKKITISSNDLIGVYYSYQSFDKTGTIHYIYRIAVTKENTYSTYHNVDYYDVQFNNLSPNETIDYTAGSDSVSIRDVNLYDDEKTDAKAIKKLKQSTDMETVKENFSKETYTDTVDR